MNAFFFCPHGKHVIDANRLTATYVLPPPHISAGTIPPELGGLKVLGELNLRFNKLQGDSFPPRCDLPFARTAQYATSTYCCRL